MKEKSDGEGGAGGGGGGEEKHIQKVLSLNLALGVTVSKLCGGSLGKVDNPGPQSPPTRSKVRLWSPESLAPGVNARRGAKDGVTLGRGVKLQLRSPLPPGGRGTATAKK